MLFKLAHILRSFFFFLSGIVVRRKYDVIFYYPQHFNRGINSENQFFKHLLLSCSQNDISYIVFEEPEFIRQNYRNSKACPFDFIYLLIIFLRRLDTSKLTVQLKDQRIGKFISKIFFRNFYFKNFITISQSMLSIFRGISSSAILYDLQHGIIHNNKPHYLLNGIAESNLTKNDAYLLLSGSSYKNILLSNDTSAYFQDHAFVVGSGYACQNYSHEIFNHNILITLQFTHDHTDLENQILLHELSNFLNKNKSFNFYLKHHPRFNNDVDLKEILNLKNVIIAPEDLNECFKLCSLHATSYSTTTFESALNGIPTILIGSSFGNNYFDNDFNYPLNYSINDFKNQRLYQESSGIVKSWAAKFYEPFNSQKFISLLK